LSYKVFEERLSKSNSQIYVFDPVRKKNLLLQPEEEVRQRIIDYIHLEKKYPLTHISLEAGLKYNKLAKRIDICVYDRSLHPFLLIECKAPDVAIDQYVLKQAVTYNEILKAPYLMLSNGQETYIFEINFIEKNSKRIITLPEF
jgi:hypothetical protein